MVEEQTKDWKTYRIKYEKGLYHVWCSTHYKESFTMYVMAAAYIEEAIRNKEVKRLREAINGIKRSGKTIKQRSRRYKKLWHQLEKYL